MLAAFALGCVLLALKILILCPTDLLPRTECTLRKSSRSVCAQARSASIQGFAPAIVLHKLTGASRRLAFDFPFAPYSLKLRTTATNDAISSGTL
jgi:hypothetical protein